MAPEVSFLATLFDKNSAPPNLFYVGDNIPS